MGGKDKKGPRTKGNTKPSSSGRSAELLGHIPEFVGFSGLPEGTFVPAVGVNCLIEDSITDSCVPAEFRVALRKMGKRDSTTKIKALQEFLELCDQASLDTLKAVLPFWPRIFSRIAIDEDRRVREGVHKAHSKLTSKVGRNLAPCLKEIMGAWFTSQCDNYAPAASLASNSLRVCFPGEKLLDAILFCHNDIMQYIADSLFKHDNSSDEQKERVLIGSMSGYSLLLQQLNVKQLETEKILKRHTELWNDSNLYKVVEKNSNLTIKQAWLGMIHNLIHYLPQVAKDNTDRIMPSVRVLFNDSESASLMILWETTLKVLVTLESATDYMKFTHSVTPKFLNLLREACVGNANKIGPLILPYIRILRTQRINSSQKSEFDQNVVEALFQGLMSRNAAKSLMEASALSIAFFQVLDDIIKTSQDFSDITRILEYTVIPTFGFMLKSSGDFVLSAFSRQMTLSLNCWFQSEENTAVHYWNLLEQLLVSLMTEDPHPNAEVVKCISLVILILLDNHPQLDNRSRLTKRSIRFADADLVTQTANECSAVAAQPPQICNAFRVKVIEVSSVICKKAFNCCERNDCEICPHLLTSLTISNDVLKACILGISSPTVETMLTSIQRMLKKFPDGSTASLFFTFLDAVDADLRCRSLESVSLDEEMCMTVTVMALENSRIHCKQSAIQWFHSSAVAKLLISSAKLTFTISDERNTYSAWKLLSMALKTKEKSSSDHLIPREHLAAVMDLLIGNLKVKQLDEEFINSFVQNFFIAVKHPVETRLYFQPSDRWLNDLLEVLCSSAHLTQESFNVLLELWGRGASCFSLRNYKSAVSIIKRKILANLENVSAERLVEIFQYALHLEVQDNPEASSELIHQLMLNPQEWMIWTKDKGACNLLAKRILNGNYFSSVPNISFFGPDRFMDWYGLIKAAFIMSSVTVRNHTRIEDWNNMMYFCYANAVADLVLEINEKRPKDESVEYIERIVEILRENVKLLLTDFPPSEQINLFKKLVDNSQRHGLIWSIATRKLHNFCEKNLTTDEVSVDILAYLSSIDGELLNRFTEIQLGKLYSFPSENWTNSLKLLASIRFLLKELNQNANMETSKTVSNVVATLQSWQLKNHDSFLFGHDLKSILQADPSSESVWTIIEIIRILSTSVELYSSQLTYSLWDFILCSMTSWCSTLEESWANVVCNQNMNIVLLSFTAAVCHLIWNCSKFVAAIERNEITSFPPNLVSEWNDVFSNAAFDAVIPLFLRLCLSSTVLDVPIFYLLETLSLSVQHVPMNHIQLTVEKVSSLLLAKHTAVQLAAYGLIKKMLPKITSNETTRIKEDLEGEGEKTERSPPQGLLFPIEKACVDSFETIRRGDLCLVEPYTSECTELLGYLLGWDVILRLCGYSGSELRYQYASYLSNSKLVSRLMDILFCIIPHATLQQQFDLEMEFLPDITVTTKTIQDVAVMVYSSALRYLPAVVRRWCNNADKRTASLVEKFTSRCVSPVLCTLDLQFCTKTWDNMVVRVRPTAREVVATYKLNEEGSMELIMQLPINYPLGTIVVETGKKVGVTSNQWRSWILQLQTFLMQQNGSILDGLSLWKRNVDKKFEGIEECYICYYVLHGSNYQLPKLSCRTCRKKFHADCLYKWFSTSNNSTCPLCRNLF